MKWGFTGSQSGCDDEIIIKVLAELPLEIDDIVVTGGCIGIDAQVFYIVTELYPLVRQLVVFPGYLKKVDGGIIAQAKEAIYMPKESNYRDRNERLVTESDKMTAFWTGKQRSGTYMTINIARRANKLHRIIHLK